MSDYDPEQHSVDTDRWIKEKSRNGTGVTIDHGKPDKPLVSLAYWAWKGSKPSDRYRVHVTAQTLSEAIYKAERKEREVVLGGFVSGDQG